MQDGGKNKHRARDKKIMVGLKKERLGGVKRQARGVKTGIGK